MPLMRCPLHDDDTPSLSFDTTRGLYICFGCGARGDLFSLAVLSGLDVAAAARMAYDEGEGTFAALAPARTGPYVPPALQSPTARASGWLRKRGIEINERGEITNIEAGRLPHFEEGEMVLGIAIWCAVLQEIGDDYGHAILSLVWEQWQYYRVMQKRRKAGKYYATPGFPRGRCVGLAGDRPGPHLYVCEGVLDGLAVLRGQEASGKAMPSGPVYYTFGARVTHDQATLLRSLCGDRAVVLAFDNDADGMDATFALLRVFPDANVLLYTGKDPGEGLLAPEPWSLAPGMEWLTGRTK